MNERRRLNGVVVSNKMQKTVIVEVRRTYRHRLYKKTVSSKKRYMAHDELDCQLGDQVVIVESQPLSKRKRWAVEKILSSDISAQEPEAAEEVEA
jgi:small subunit ribosomal protein S17